MSDEKRCEAGQAEEPTDCDRHPKHAYCEWCEGWYGVPHMSMCHTAEVRRSVRNPSKRAPRGHCACRYCQVYDKHGYQFAEALFRGKGL